MKMVPKLETFPANRSFEICLTVVEIMYFLNNWRSCFKVLLTGN